MQSERWWLGAYVRMRHPGSLGQGLWGSEGEIRSTERLTNIGYDMGKYDGTRLSFFTLFKTSQLRFVSTAHEILVKISFVRENYLSY